MRAQLEALARDFNVREIMIQDLMTGFAARLHSNELMAEFMS